MSDSIIPEARQKVLDKIAEYERLGGENFFNDVEDDPTPKVLMPEDVDYLKKKLSSKFKNFVCRRKVNKMLKDYCIDHKIVVEGVENLKDIKGGAIITTNHYHYLDSAPLVYTLKHYKIKKKMHIVIREGNYQIPGLFGFILRNYYTFPLSSNIKTTVNLNKAIDTVIKRGEFVLVYPEQAMWWKYKKPRFYKIGAFRWASRNNVPVVPCFVTMQDGEKLEDDGLYSQDLTLHIGKPIYPDPNLTEKQNAEYMLEKNKEFTVDVYEKTYGKKYDLKG